MDFFAEHYQALRACHIIAVVAWMAGMLYLPRLFVYHATAPRGGELSETLKIMERRLLRFIMNPAMIATWIFGLCMLAGNPGLLEQGWMHVKILGVVLMSGAHGAFSAWRRRFANDANQRDAKFYRIWNEVPTLLMIVIVVMAVVEPF